MGKALPAGGKVQQAAPVLAVGHCHPAQAVAVGTVHPQHGGLAQFRCGGVSVCQRVLQRGQAGFQRRLAVLQPFRVPEPGANGRTCSRPVTSVSAQMPATAS